MKLTYTTREWSDFFEDFITQETGFTNVVISPIYDDRGRRYLDGLAGLFVVQAGHGRRVLAEAAAKQAEGDRAAREAKIEADRSVQERTIESEKAIALRRQQTKAEIAKESEAVSTAAAARAKALAVAADKH